MKIAIFSKRKGVWWHRGGENVQFYQNNYINVIFNNTRK